MRLAAHVGVRDEAWLIPLCIAHLRALGVEEFIVFDVASRDGSREWLRTQEGPGFRVVDIAADAPIAEWRRLNALALADCRADWALVLDADEFPLPAGGDLRAALAAASPGAEVLQVPRHNVVLGPRGLHMPLPPGPADLAATDLYALSDPAFRKRLEADPTLCWLRFMPAPKVVARPHLVAEVAFGGHEVTTTHGRPPRREPARGLITAHVALSDYPRFLRKMDHAREVLRIYGPDLPPGFAWHWRRWLDLQDRGLLRAEYDRSILDAQGLAELRAQGVVRSAAELLAGAP